MNKALLITGSAILLMAGGLSAEAATTAPAEANGQATANADQVGTTKMNMRQQIQQQLAKSGYTDVNVMPSSFFIHAKDSHGNPVEMVIGPDTFTEVTEITQKNAAVQQPAAPNHAANTADKTQAPKT